MEERAWFEQVYRQNVDLLFRVGRRLLDSDENPDTLYDMVQEIFLLLWDRRETLKTHPNIGGWLMAALCVGIVGALLGLFSAFMPPIVSYFVPWGYFEPLSAYEVAVWDQATHTVIYGTRPYNWALLLATIALGLLLFALGALAVIAAQLVLSMIIRSFAVPIFLGLLGGIAGMLAGAKGYSLLWPYALMQMGMNANKSEDVLSGRYVPFLLSCMLWTAGMFAAAWLAMKKRDVKA